MQVPRPSPECRRVFVGDGGRTQEDSEGAQSSSRILSGFHSRSSPLSPPRPNIEVVPTLPLASQTSDSSCSDGCAAKANEPEFHL